MTPREKCAHLRDLLRRQRECLRIALRELQDRPASQAHHMIDEADRFADLADRTAWTMFEGNEIVNESK